MTGTALVPAGGFGAPACAGPRDALPSSLAPAVVPRYCAVGDDWVFSVDVRLLDGVSPYDLTGATVTIDAYFAYAAAPLRLAGTQVIVVAPTSGHIDRIAVPGAITANAEPQDPGFALSYPTCLVVGLIEGGVHRTVGTIPICPFLPRVTQPFPALDTSPAKFLVAPLPPVPIQIGGTPGQAYAHIPFAFTPTLQYGKGARTFALTGTLPSGWAFDPTSGTISGTVTTAATLGDLAITVTDGSGSATLDLGALVVAPYPPLTLVSAPTLSTTTPHVGDTIVATHGVWADVTGAIVTPDSYNMSWRSSTTPSPGSNAAVGNYTPSYTVQPSDAGRYLQVAEVAVMFGVSATSVASSAFTAQVPAGAVNLAGAVPGQGALTGTPTEAAPGSTTLAGAVPGQGALTGAPSETPPGNVGLSGNIPGQGTLAGIPSESPPGTMSLAGNVPGQGSLTGTPTETAANPYAGYFFPMAA